MLDTWFRGLELKYGPDGAVYLTDWYDTGECHETDSDNAHRENGRIYKIVYGTPKPFTGDLAKLGPEFADQAHPRHHVGHVAEQAAHVELVARRRPVELVGRD